MSQHLPSGSVSCCLSSFVPGPGLFPVRLITQGSLSVGVLSCPVSSFLVRSRSVSPRLPSSCSDRLASLISVVLLRPGHAPSSSSFLSLSPCVSVSFPMVAVAIRRVQCSVGGRSPPQSTSSSSLACPSSPPGLGPSLASSVLSVFLLRSSFVPVSFPSIHLLFSLAVSVSSFSSRLPPFSPSSSSLPVLSSGVGWVSVHLLFRVLPSCISLGCSCGGLVWSPSGSCAVRICFLPGSPLVPSSVWWSLPCLSCAFPCVLSCLLFWFLSVSTVVRSSFCPSSRPLF